MSKYAPAVAALFGIGMIATTLYSQRQQRKKELVDKVASDKKFAAALRKIEYYESQEMDTEDKASDDAAYESDRQKMIEQWKEDTMQEIDSLHHTINEQTIQLDHLVAMNVKLTAAAATVRKSYSPHHRSSGGPSGGSSRGDQNNGRRSKAQNNGCRRDEQRRGQKQVTGSG